MSLIEEFKKMEENYHGHPMFLELSLQELELHSSKNRDYAHGGNPLGNFYRVSDMLKAFGLNISPAQVAFIFMMKQLDSVGRMLFQGYEGKVEGVDAKLADIPVYGKLIRILKREEQQS